MLHRRHPRAPGANRQDKRAWARRRERLGGRKVFYFDGALDVNNPSTVSIPNPLVPGDAGALEVTFKSTGPNESGLDQFVLNHGSNQTYIRFKPTGVLQVRCWGDEYFSPGAGVIVQDEVYTIKMEWDAGGVGNDWRWYLNGVIQPVRTQGSAASTAALLLGDRGDFNHSFKGALYDFSMWTDTAGIGPANIILVMDDEDNNLHDSGSDMDDQTLFPGTFGFWDDL